MNIHQYSRRRNGLSILRSEWTHPNVMDIFVAIIRDNHMIVDCYHNLYKALYRIPAQKREQVKVSSGDLDFCWAFINANKAGAIMPLLS